MNRVGLIVFGAGISGLLAWIGVRASIWLSGELAYHRWRRQRVHTIVLRRPERDRPSTLCLTERLCGMTGRVKPRNREKVALDEALPEG